MTDEGLIKLLGLADFLECDVAAAEKRSGRQKLRMERWFDSGDTGLNAPSLEVEGCGTSACALGWATVAFPRAGLTIKRKPCRNCGNPARACKLIATSVHFGAVTNWAAAQKFFGLDSLRAAGYLFTSNAGGDSVRAVVRRIRNFVLEKWEAQAEASA